MVSKMIYESYVIGGYLMHHGIKGQKWGTRNGPPYPLKPGMHSASEKKQRARIGKEGMDPEIAFAIAEIAISTALIFSPAIVELIRKGKDKTNNKKAEEKLKEIRENKKGTIDEKTGFHMKNKETSVEEDLKHVNPAHSTSSNTNNNCVYCSATFEMRRRGYDVSANLSPEGMNGRKVITDLFPGSKVNNIDTNDFIDKKSDPINPKFNPINKTEFNNTCRIASYGLNKSYAKDVVNILSKEKDSRGCLLVSWGIGGGHAVNYEVKNGVVRVLDGQSGKIYSGNDLEKLLSSTVLVANIRLDNQKFDSDKVKKVMN